MLSCVKSQKTETAERNETNMFCRTETKNLGAVEDILAKGIRALKKFCDKLEERMDGLENFTLACAEFDLAPALLRRGLESEAKLASVFVPLSGTCVRCFVSI